MQVHRDEGVANRIDPQVMRRCPRGHRRSVDRGAHRPAIEPRKYPHPRGDVRSADGRQPGSADSPSAQTARRGRRHWHVRTLFAREPGDLMVGQRHMRAALVRVGKARSRSR